ncbi:hypothetical protein [Paenibacillus sp. B-A-8]
MTQLTNEEINEFNLWLYEESCARCGLNTPVVGYEWCAECRPGLKTKT